MPEFTWLPANQATTADVEALFAKGGAYRCRCQALKVPGWIWRDTTQEQRDVALLEQTACGTAGPTSGPIGYVDGEADGWVAVSLTGVIQCAWCPLTDYAAGSRSNADPRLHSSRRHC